ncbi:MAG: outer membrane protein transport protein [Phycisphaerales bacterium]|nr:MAG: outer membrane protein transport protein [Phycisphaerales bacterium]
MSFSNRRHRRMLAIIVSGLAVAMSHRADAGGYEWGGLGSRAQSMGGAFIGLADDWTAIYWNPAGLTQLRGLGAGIEFFSPHIESKDGDSLANPPVAQMDRRFQRDVFGQYPPELEPPRFNREKVKYDFYIPAGAAGHWRSAGLNMAVGYYTPAGYYIDWDDRVPYGTGTITAELFQELNVTAINFSLAKRINWALSLGAGLDILYGQVDYEVNKIAANSGISDYRYSFDSGSDGTGYEGVFGALYRVNQKVSLGGVYRTGGTIELEGRARTSLSLTTLSEASDFVQKFRHPATYGLGVAYRWATNLIFTADWQRTDWSEFDIDIEYDTPGTALVNQDYSADWRDSNRFRAGVEWRPVLRWALRGGYFFDESPLPDKSVSLSNIVGVDRHNVTLGAGYEWGDSWFVDLVLHHAWGDRTVDSVDYSQRIYSLGVSLSHRF